MHHTGRVVSRTELVEHLYDQDFDRDSNTIEVFVGRIRKKLGVDIIQTVRGLGYLLTPPAARPRKVATGSLIRSCAPKRERDCFAWKLAPFVPAEAGTHFSRQVWVPAS